MEVRQKARDTTENSDVYTGPIGQITVDTDRNDLRVHDGTTLGGHRIPNLAFTDSRYVRIGITDSINMDQVIGLEDALLGIRNRLDAIEAPEWVTDDRIADDAIRTRHILDGEITLAKLAPNSVNSSKIVDKSIQAIDIADGVIPTNTLPQANGIGAYTFAYYRDFTATYGGSESIAINATTPASRLGHLAYDTPGNQIWQSYGWTGTYRCMTHALSAAGLNTPYITIYQYLFQRIA